VAREHIPDPLDEQTFMRSRLNWTQYRQLTHQRWLDLHRELLHLRRENIVPRLTNMHGGQRPYQRRDNNLVIMEWTLGDGARLTLIANLSEHKNQLQIDTTAPGDLLYATHAEPFGDDAQDPLPPWAVYWYLTTPEPRW